MESIKGFLKSICFGVFIAIIGLGLLMSCGNNRPSNVTAEPAADTATFRSYTDSVPPCIGQVQVLAKFISHEGGSKIHRSTFGVIKDFSRTLSSDTITVDYYFYKAPEENLDTVVLFLNPTNRPNEYVCPDYDGRNGIRRKKEETREKPFITVDSCIINNNRLYLCDDGYISVLKIKRNGEFHPVDTLLLKASCRFLREKNEVQNHSFDDIGVTSVIFVVGNREQSSPNYSAMQGIIFKKDSIIISKRKVDVDINANQWIDGKFFLDVAYYP